MTDKEKLEKIKRLADDMYNKMAYLTSDTRPIRKAMEDYHSFIVHEYNKDEQVDKPIDFEKELYKQFGQAKDFTLGMQIAKRFYEMGMQQQEPVSEDLEDAAIDICSKVLKGETIIIDGYEYVVLSDAEECFKAGAKWQKKQTDKQIEDAIKVHTTGMWRKDESKQVGKDLEELVNTLSQRYQEVSFAKLSRIVVATSKWQKEQDFIVAKDCEEAAEKYAQEAYSHPVDRNVGKADFILGAQWQMAQMIKDATDVTIHVDAGGFPYIPQMELYDYDKDIHLAKEGDKYKVVLIKEG